MSGRRLAFDIPEWRKIRVIIDTDAKNEADDQFAIVHGLLTPRFDILGIVAAQFENTGSMMERRDTMRQSYDEIEKLLSLTGFAKEAPAIEGALKPLESLRSAPESPGADLIVEEAMKEGEKPLFAVFMGPLTNMAIALLREPRVAERVTVVWIGGEDYPNGGWEYNLFNDIHAANVVFASGVELWQVPRGVYSTIRISIAELIHKVRPCGKVGAYLVEQLCDFNNSMKYPEWPKGEMWSLGDSPCISLLLDEHEYGYKMLPRPRISSDMYYIHEKTDRKVRVYHYVDSRFTLEDMFAKLALHYL
ncbi:nucleoside hydrolase [Pelagicoccus albus]|uniref:nucleoside hydrolase n=1 Tax=Pelagicoccus albus TaxID=415222 RepID=UPI001C8B7938|nr:nucleoside hydrolase [Pelagicoccus albus]